MRWIMSVKQEIFTLIQVKNADNFTKNQEWKWNTHCEKQNESDLDRMA